MKHMSFSGKADIYAKYRPNYPEEFLEYLYAGVGISANSVIADIGSGTGILTRQLLLRGNNVFAIEPNSDMADVATNKLNHFKNYMPVNAVAENTTLPDSSVDFITVAQAFHWFNKDRFRLECHRILKFNGKVILVWNTRVTTSELVQENEEINKKYCHDFKGFSGGVNTNATEEFDSFFKKGIYEHRIFNNNIEFNKKRFVGRNLSASYAPKRGDELFYPYVAALEELFDKYQKNGVLSMPNYTRSYVGKI